MSPSRREVLKSLAGLGVISCVGRLGSRPIVGSIIGASHARGHRIRDGFRPVAKGVEETGVVIVGAGVAGLSAAWALERAGFEHFLLLELEDAPGGTARSGVSPVSAYPWGAHYVTVPSPQNRPMVALLQEVGAVRGRDAAGRPVYAEEVLCRDPQERLFFKGEWYEGLFPRAGAAKEDLAQLQAFEDDMRRWAAWRDGRGRRGFDLPRARGSDDAFIRDLDSLSVAGYMDRKGWTSRRFRWFVEYGCRDDFGSTLDETSAWAGIHYFASRIEGAGSEPAEFLTWPEGNGRLVNHMAALAGPRLHLGALVTDIAPGRDGVEVTYFDEARQRAVRVQAEHAIMAAPRFLVGRLVAPYRPTPPPHLRETVYGCWMVANLSLSDRPSSRGFPLAWDNVLYDSPSLGYVVATHQAGRDFGPTVLTYYLPFTDADPRRSRTRALSTPWEEWVARILADLEPAHPGIRGLVERVDVCLWGHAMVRPRTGFLWSDALALSARPLGRVRFAHTDLSGIALFEEAQYWGVRAAEDVLRALGRAFRSWLE